MSNTVIEINLANFTTNLQAITNQLTHINPQGLFCLPVKANAYGHGLVKIAQLAHGYVDYFAVANLDEGVILRQNQITKPILVFGAFIDDEIGELIANDLEITISSLYKAKQVQQYCLHHSCMAKVQLKVDTGMNRIGVRAESSYELIDQVLIMPNLQLIGVYSHLASSDDNSSNFTNLQIELFEQVVAYIKKINPQIICHIANSGGLCYYPNSCFDMIRPGILSYGYLPNPDLPLPQRLSAIKPCFSLKSKVTYFKVVEADSGISYNHTYHTKTRTRIVTIPIGYGDGYRRILSNIGPVIIHGIKHQICGTICMDMLMVDIGFQNSAHVGDEVVLIGTQGSAQITVEELAQLCSTITYEILSGFTSRIPRIYK